MPLFERGNRPTSLLRNLNQQPFPPSDLASWTAVFGPGGAGTTEYRTGGQYGLPYFRMTWTTAATSTAGGFERLTGPGAVTPGLTYTVSGWVRLGRTNTIYAAAVFYNAAGTPLTVTAGQTVNNNKDAWVWLSVTFVAPANASGVGLRFYASTASNGTSWAANDTLDVTGLMLTEGQTVPYFDGNFSMAAWEGTPGNSRSTTQALFGIFPLSRLFEMGTLLFSSGHTASQAVVIETGPFSSAQPLTMYAAHVAGTTSARSNFQNGATSVFGVGRTGAGTGWFVQGINSSGSTVAPSLSRAVSANVLCGQRDRTYLNIHSLAGNQYNDAGIISSWPSLATIDRFSAASDLRYSELWTGLHPGDIRYARMMQIKTNYAIPL